MPEDAKKKLLEELEKMKRLKEAAKATGLSLKEQAAAEEKEQEETGETQPS